MYCVKCGVELKKGAQMCPLCGTMILVQGEDGKIRFGDLVENPEPSQYPKYTGEPEKVNPHGIMFALTGLFAVALIICVLTDVLMTKKITWSGFAAAGLASGYVTWVLPWWFKKPTPVIFFPAAMASVLLAALYVCLKTGGNWFLSFALPVGAAFTAIIETVIVLVRYTVKKVRHRLLFIFGGALIALGGLCMLIEFLLHVTFGTPMVWWSVIPLVSLFVLGMILIVSGISPKLRLFIYKRSFI